MKEQIANITDTCDRMGTVQNIYWMKKIPIQRVNAAWFIYIGAQKRINQVYNDRISGCLGLGSGTGIGIGVKRHRKHSSWKENIPTSWLCYGLSDI